MRKWSEYLVSILGIRPVFVFTARAHLFLVSGIFCANFTSLEDLREGVVNTRSKKEDPTSHSLLQNFELERKISSIPSTFGFSDFDCTIFRKVASIAFIEQQATEE